MHIWVSHTHLCQACVEWIIVLVALDIDDSRVNYLLPTPKNWK